ncbi:hypothetical protein [Nitratireductor sp. StC3]|uniref:hypothetical protein n=1 Tax=Nitratireductor sp. StC3 TaxID=2126741 RepID=UPI001FE10BD0|nr:hypothetical protein [Nitratireductor sp. StC3]
MEKDPRERTTIVTLGGGGAGWFIAGAWWWRFWSSSFCLPADFSMDRRRPASMCPTR